MGGGRRGGGSGPQAGIKEAKAKKKAQEEALRRPEKNYREVPIPAEMLGAFIGMNGDTIKALQLEAKIAMQVKQKSAAAKQSGESGAAYVQIGPLGASDDVQRAEELVKHKVEQITEERQKKIDKKNQELESECGVKSRVREADDGKSRPVLIGPAPADALASAAELVEVPKMVAPPPTATPSQKDGKVPKTAAAPQAAAPSQKESKDKSDKSRRTCLHTQLRKTKICMYHLRGACQYSTNCAFAHTCSELQGTPDLAKTRLCKAFVQGGCTDPECTFAHGEEELRSTNMFFKKTLCMWNEKGKCRNGDQCRFAHGSTELRNAGGVLPEEGKQNSAKEAGSAKAAAGTSQPSNGAAAVRRKERKQVLDALKSSSVLDEQQLQELQQQQQQLLAQLQLQQQLQAAIAGGASTANSPYPNPASAASAEPMKVKSSFVDASPMVRSQVSAHRYDDQLKGQLEQLQQMISVLSVRCNQIQTQMDSTPWSPTAQQDGLPPSLDLRMFV